MSRRREIDARLKLLGEIREIMSSLKTLALLETRKLARFADTQRGVLDVVETASGDFAGHFPMAHWQPACAAAAFVVLGSERGFCGNYNETLVAALTDALAAEPRPGLVFAVGQRLVSRLPPGLTGVVPLPGPDAAEQIEQALLGLLDAVSRRQHEVGPLALTVLHHLPLEEAVQRQPLFPVMPSPATGVTGGPAPALNLAPGELFRALLDARLFAGLHAAFYDALAAENHRRMAHLQGAVDHIDRRRAEYALQRNALRQEEITEEIELILLNAPSGGP
ncbi:MAG TPA: F0F1 ATP synthase subunit gamma [Gammaproteobacteria bacterium]|nr:F0F1 ATP synthase subunit gamma [Gammaproteobacteria bacterium]